MIRPLVPYIQQKFLADSLQTRLMIRFEGRLVTFRSVINNTCRLKTPWSERSGRPLDQCIGAGLVGNLQPVFDSQPVTVQIVVLVLLDRPDVGNFAWRAKRRRGQETPP